jgi:hypothetical protein
VVRHDHDRIRISNIDESSMLKQSLQMSTLAGFLEQSEIFLPGYPRCF